MCKNSKWFNLLKFKLLDLIEFLFESFEYWISNNNYHFILVAFLKEYFIRFTHFWILKCKYFCKLLLLQLHKGTLQTIPDHLCFRLTIVILLYFSNRFYHFWKVQIQSSFSQNKFENIHILLWDFQKLLLLIFTDDFMILISLYHSLPSSETALSQDYPQKTQ